MKNMLYVFAAALCMTAFLTACGSPKVEPVAEVQQDSAVIEEPVDTIPQTAELDEEDMAYLQEATNYKNVLTLIDKMWEMTLVDKSLVLKKTGMHIIYKSVEEDEEEPITYIEYYCARNAEAGADENGFFFPQPTGPHAIVVGVNLATDNDEYVYFSDKDDFEVFKAQAEKDQRIYWSFEKRKNWFVARGHMG